LPRPEDGASGSPADRPATPASAPTPKPVPATATTAGLGPPAAPAAPSPRRSRKTAAAIACAVAGAVALTLWLGLRHDPPPEQPVDAAVAMARPPESEAGVVKATGPSDATPSTAQAPAPVASEPPDGDSVRSYPLSLRWTSAGEEAAGGFDVEVARLGSGGEEAETKSLHTPLDYANWPWDESVPLPGEYRWRVRVSGDAPGAWSVPRSFRYYPSALERVRALRVLRVGREVTYHRPFVYLDPQSGEVVGFDVDLANEIARRLGAAAQFIELDWNTELFQSLDQERTDVVISAVSITEARRQKWGFSNAYLWTGQRFTVRADDPRTFDPAVETFRAGTQRGTSSAEAAKRTLGEAQVQLFDSNDLAIAALAAGDIDALVADETISPARRDPRFRFAGPRLSEEGYGVMIRKGESSLLAAVDTILGELTTSGWLTAQLRRYELPDTPAPTPPPSPADADAR
jgi:ABC-type amino acid transport substrate-binding protein